MRNRLRLPALAFMAVLLVAACGLEHSPGPTSGGAATGGPASRPAGVRRRPRPKPQPGRGAPTPEPATDCAQSTADNAMQMWERSGGNKGMVDQLVCAWNAANPDKPINLTLHPARRDGRQDRPGHRLRRRARPDGHGPDLCPAVRERRPARRHHRQDHGLARARDRQPGPHDRRDVQRAACSACRCTPTSRRSSTTRTCSRRRGLDPNKPPTSLAELRDVRRQDHRARRRHQGLLPAGQLRRLQHLHRRPADVGLRRDRSRPASAVTSRSSATASRQVLQCGRDMVTGRQRPRAAPGPRTARRSTSSSAPARSGMMGTGNFNITLARDQMKDHEFEFGISLLPGIEAGQVRVVHRRRPRRHPEGQQARRRRRRLHEVPAVRRDPGRGLCQGAQPDHPLRHGRQQVLRGRAARPGRGEGAGRRPDARTPSPSSSRSTPRRAPGCRCSSGPTTPTTSSTRSSPTPRTR